MRERRCNARGRVQRPVEQRAVRIDGRRCDPRDAHGKAIAGSDGWVVGIRGEARIRAVRETVAPNRIVDLHDGAGAQRVQRAVHFETSLCIVDRSDESNAGVRYFLRNGQDQRDDVATGRIAGHP